MGVRLHQGVRATGIRVRKGRVEGVVTNTGFVATEVVVNAGGPWTVEIGRFEGKDIKGVRDLRVFARQDPDYEELRARKAELPKTRFDDAHDPEHVEGLNWLSKRF